MQALRLAGSVDRLLKTGGTLQSTASGPIDDEEIVRAIAAALEKAQVTEGVDLQGTPANSLARDTVRAARNAIERVREGAGSASVSDGEYSALQVIVRVIGRPAIGFRRDQLEPIDEGLGENDHWIRLIGDYRKTIEARARSIGRVTLTSRGDATGTLGTAWRADDGLVVTNRHVVARLVSDSTLGVPHWRLSPDARAVVDFAAVADPGQSRQFAVDELVYCSPDEGIDVAVLRLAAANGALPDPIPIDFDEAALGTRAQDGGAFSGKEIYIVGHPYEPAGSTPIELVFRKADGLKRLSPGLVQRADRNSTLIEHDCSTLGGHSGAAVLSMDHRVVGIHVGGLGAAADARGDANVAVALCRIAEHPAGRILKGGSR